MLLRIQIVEDMFLRPDVECGQTTYEYKNSADAVTKDFDWCSYSYKHGDCSLGSSMTYI